MEREDGNEFSISELWQELAEAYFMVLIKQR
jgi:hypothetical protein